MDVAEPDRAWGTALLPWLGHTPHALRASLMQTTPHCGSPSELRMALLPEHWPWYALLVQELEGIVKRKAEANQDLNAEQGKSSAEQRRVRKQSTYSGLGRVRPPTPPAPKVRRTDFLPPQVLHRHMRLPRHCKTIRRSLFQSRTKSRPMSEWCRKHVLRTRGASDLLLHRHLG